MPFKPVNYGNILAQTEAIKSQRFNNSLAQQRANESSESRSLQNELNRAKIEKLQREAQNPQSGIDPTAPMRNYQERQRLIANGATPEQLATFDNYVRAMKIREIAGVQTEVRPGGDLNPLSDQDAEAEWLAREADTKRRADLGARIELEPELKNLTITAGNKADMGLGGGPSKGDVEALVIKKRFEQEKANQRPKREAAADAALDRTVALKELVQQARTQATGMTTGFAGSMTKGVAGTPAHDLSQTLLTLQANAGFDRLQEMRDNSVTGGALGQVSERELGLLMAAYAALEQSQSKGQFLQNLGRFEKQVDQSWKRVKLAYRLDYGEDYKETAKTAQTARNEMSDGDYQARRKALLGVD